MISFHITGGENMGQVPVEFIVALASVSILGSSILQWFDSVCNHHSLLVGILLRFIST